MNMQQVTVSHSVSAELLLDGALIDPEEVGEADLMASVCAIKMTSKERTDKSVIVAYYKDLWEKSAEYRSVVENMGLQQLSELLATDSGVAS